MKLISASQKGLANFFECMCAFPFVSIPFIFWVYVRLVYWRTLKTMYVCCLLVSVNLIVYKSRKIEWIKCKTIIRSLVFYVKSFENSNVAILYGIKWIEVKWRSIKLRAFLSVELTPPPPLSTFLFTLFIYFRLFALNLFGKLFMALSNDLGKNHFSAFHLFVCLFYVWHIQMVSLKWCVWAIRRAIGRNDKQSKQISNKWIMK